MSEWQTEVDATDALLLETVDCLRDLLGDLIDLQPPDTQHRIAHLQVRLLEAMERYAALQGSANVLSKAP